MLGPENIIHLMGSFLYRGSTVYYHQITAMISNIISCLIKANEIRMTNTWWVLNSNIKYSCTEFKDIDVVFYYLMNKYGPSKVP